MAGVYMHLASDLFHEDGGWVVDEGRITLSFKRQPPPPLLLLLLACEEHRAPFAHFALDRGRAMKRGGCPDRVGAKADGGEGDDV